MSLTENIVQAIADNSLLAQWCVTNYSQAQTVQLGIDLDRLPPDEDYPIVMVAQVTTKEGAALDLEEASYVITCGISDDADPVSVGRVKGFDQVTDLESFRTLVLSAVETADLAGGHVAEVEVENDPVELFPIFSTNMIVKIHCFTASRSRWVK